MSTQILPVTNDPNQNFQSTMTIDDRNMTLEFDLRYNEQAGYWVMTISNPAQGVKILDSIPLLTGVGSDSNILGQYAYLGIGSFYLLSVGDPGSGVTSENLGTDYLVVWGDTPNA